MRLSKTAYRWVLALVSGALLAVLSASCTGQGEGERCQLANGNDDCQSGLVCYAASTITLPGTTNQSNADICCPANRADSTEDICKTGNATPTSDASINDSSSNPDTGTDASGDATGSDATGDATSSDASGDATSSDGSSDATGQ
jgi:hypothetical protein